MLPPTPFEIWKPRVIRHGLCLFFGWIIGPYFAAWTVEALVAMGVRGDFTLLDFLWRVIIIVALELAWFYASSRKTIVPPIPR